MRHSRYLPEEYLLAFHILQAHLITVTKNLIWMGRWKLLSLKHKENNFFWLKKIQTLKHERFNWPGGSLMGNAARCH